MVEIDHGIYIYKQNEEGGEISTIIIVISELRNISVKTMGKLVCTGALIGWMDDLILP